MKNTKQTTAEPIEVPIKLLCQILDLSPRRVQQLSVESILYKVESGRYNLGASVRGYVQYLRKRALSSGTADIDASRIRRMNAQAELTEMELDERRGGLVSVDEVVKVVGREYSFLRAHLLAMPAKLAAGLVDLSHAEIEERLHSEINETLETLQADQPGDGRKPRSRIKKNTPRQPV